MVHSKRISLGRVTALAVGFAAVLLFAVSSSDATAATACVAGPGDRPETTLQGGLTVAKRDAPGGFQGEWCGMRQVGHHDLGLRGSFGDIQLIGLCAYASMRDPSNLSLPTTGTSVIDMRVPSQPVWTQTLRTPAMQRAYSALEIQKTTMVAAFKDFGPDNSANNQSDNWFDIYDVSGDCLNPRHLATTTTASGNHDGWLTPDTNFYYGIPFGGQTIQQNPNRIDVHVLDLTDKAKPVQLLNWNRLQLPAEVQARTLATRNFHDVSTNDDGTRLYLALYGGNNALGGNPPDGSGRCANGLLILDSSDVAWRLANPQLRYIGFLSWCPEQQTGSQFVDPDYGDGSTAASHATEFVIHENGRPYILSTDESGAGLDGEWNQHIRQRTFSRLIDISDDANPRVVSTFKPDVNDPDNALQVATDQINGGMLHYIGFDDRYKMRLVFYAGANQGIRVVDFRVPESPKEIAYYKAPNVATTRVGENDFTRPDPRYDQENCLLYTGWNQGGLRILELTNPEYNACMRRDTNGGGWIEVSGKKANFGFEAQRLDGGLGSLQGTLQLNDRAGGAKIHIDKLTALGSVHDQCGAVLPVLPTAKSVQFEGTGTYNGASASFRVCVQDNGEGNKVGADRFYLTCTAGCTYSVGGEVGGGNIQVRQR
jgi:hypothetical protein